MGFFFLSHVLICSNVYLYISIVSGYLSYTLILHSNTTLFYGSTYSGFGHWELFHLPLMYLWQSPINVCVVFWALSYFLALQDTSISSCVFPAPLEKLHFSKKPWFLLLESGMRNQDLGARYLPCYWDIISFKFLFHLMTFLNFPAYLTGFSKMMVRGRVQLQ